MIVTASSNPRTFCSASWSTPFVGGCSTVGCSPVTGVRGPDMGVVGHEYTGGLVGFVRGPPLPAASSRLGRRPPRSGCLDGGEHGASVRLGRSGPELSPQLKVTPMEPSRTRARQLLDDLTACPEAAFSLRLYRVPDDGLHPGNLSCACRVSDAFERRVAFSPRRICEFGKGR
jgi:hypothetical protein